MTGIPYLLRAREVANLMGVPFKTLQRQLPKLQAEHGFPRPLPGLGRRYDPGAIVAWLNRMAVAGERPAGAPDPDAAASPGDLAGWQDELDRRADQIARTGGHA
jgi:hypothetical protein